MKSASKKYVVSQLSILCAMFLCSIQLHAAECVLHPKLQGEFGIFLLNDKIVEGGQFRVTSDVKGFHITDITLTPRAAGFEVVFSQEAHDSTWLVIFYSLQGKVIMPGNGDILTMHLATAESGDSLSQIIVSDIVLGGENAEKLVKDETAECYAGTFNSHADKPLVPEPSMLTFWMLGMLMLCFSARARRRKQDHRRALQTCSPEKITPERMEIKTVQPMLTQENAHEFFDNVFGNDVEKSDYCRQLRADENG